jgi:hypothetical protein
MVVQDCSPSTHEDEAEGYTFKASLGYIVRLSQKIKWNERKNKRKKKKTQAFQKNLG